LPGFTVVSDRGLGACDCVPGSSNCAHAGLEPIPAANPAITAKEKRFRIKKKRRHPVTIQPSNEFEIYALILQRWAPPLLRSPFPRARSIRVDLVCQAPLPLGRAIADFPRNLADAEAMFRLKPLPCPLV
jgi:hypothetical protein